jgi:hypothetical protein
MNFQYHRFLEINAEKSRCKVTSRHQIARHNHDIDSQYVLPKCGTVQIFGNDS